MRRNHHDPHTNVTSAPPAELATNVKMTSVCAGHQLREPPAGIEPATPSLPFVWSRSYRGAVQVKVTRVTVSDRQQPPETAPYGTQMARRPVRLNLGRRGRHD